MSSANMSTGRASRSSYYDKLKQRKENVKLRQARSESTIERKKQMHFEAEASALRSQSVSFQNDYHQGLEGMGSIDQSNDVRAMMREPATTAITKNEPGSKSMNILSNDTSMETHSTVPSTASIVSPARCSIHVSRRNIHSNPSMNTFVSSSSEDESSFTSASSEKLILRAEVVELKSHLSEVKTRAMELETKLEEERKRHSKVESKLLEENHFIKSYTENRRQYKDVVDDDGGDNDDDEEISESVNKNKLIPDRKQLEKLLKRVQKKVKMYKTALDESEAYVATLEKTMDEHLATWQEEEGISQKQIAILTKNINNESRLSRELKLQYDERENELQTQIEKLNEELGRAESYVRESETKAKEMERLMEEEVIRADDLKGEIILTKNKLQKSEFDLELSRQQLEELTVRAEKKEMGLRSRFQELERKYLSSQDELEKYLKQLEAMETLKDMKVSQANEMVKTISSLESELQKAKEEIKQYQRMPNEVFTAQQKEIEKNLRKQVEELEEQVAMAEIEVELSRKQNENIKEESGLTDMLKEEIVALNAQLKNAREEARKSTRKIEHLNSKLAYLEGEAQKEVSRLKLLDEEKSTKWKNIETDFLTSIATLENQLRMAQTETQEWRKKVNESTAATDVTYEQNKNAINEECFKSEESAIQAKSLDGMISTKDNETTNLQAEIECLNRHLQNSKSQHESICIKLKAEQSKWDQEKKTLTSKYERQLCELKSLMESKEMYQLANSELAKVKAYVSEEKSEVNKELSSCTATIRSHEERIEELLQKLNDTQDELQLLRSSSSEEVKKLKKIEFDLVIKCNALKGRYAQLQDDYNTCKERFEKESAIHQNAKIWLLSEVARLDDILKEKEGEPLENKKGAPKTNLLSGQKEKDRMLRMKLRKGDRDGDIEVQLRGDDGSVTTVFSTNDMATLQNQVNDLKKSLKDSRLEAKKLKEKYEKEKRSQKINELVLNSNMTTSKKQQLLHLSEKNSTTDEDI